MVRIAIAQICSSTEKSENLKAALLLTQEAHTRGAQLIAFPEFLMAFTPASQKAGELAALAESVDGPFIASLRDAAQTAGISILTTIYERCARPDRVYDTAVWIDGNGGIAAVYRKLHLYDAFGFKESDKFAAGDDVASLVKSGETRFGMMICYDLRFPEIARILALSRANIIIAPSGWVQGELKLDHWQTIIKARALENGCYVIAPNQVGNIYTGHSMVVDPLGRVLADMGVREGLEIVELDLALVDETRQKLPLLNNRRSDVYAKYQPPVKPV